MLRVCGTCLIGQSSKLKKKHSVWYHWRLVEEALWFRPVGWGRFVVRLGCVMSRGKFWIVTNIIQELLVLYSFLSLYSTFTISTSHEDKEVFSDYRTRWYGTKLTLRLKLGCRLPSSRWGLLSLIVSSSLTCANYGDGELFTPPTTNPLDSYWANNYPTG